MAETLRALGCLPLAGPDRRFSPPGRALPAIAIFGAAVAEHQDGEQAKPLGEVGDVAIEGQPVQTVAIESTELDALGETRTALGLDGAENVSYPRAIREKIHGDRD